MSIAGKWEGSALLVSTLVSGPQSYVIEDRWELSRDAAVLTISRTIRRGLAATEATLTYTRRGQADSVSPDAIVVHAGTRIPLSLVNTLDTKHSVAGDRVYLETAFPVTQNNHIIIPKGSYVAGTVTEVKRGARMKGRSELYVRFDSLTLPNGVTRNFRSRLDSADANDVDRQEGAIRGEPDKAGEVRTIGETTGVGATVGAIAGSAAGHGALGGGIGAIGGAAAGLIAVLATHGPDVVLPRGTTLEMVLDRDLRYAPVELVP